MENKQKCSCKDHLEIEAISYCHKCEIYMCNKCEKMHSNVCPKHHIYKLDQNYSEIFTEYCKEKNHYEINYFCKTHNQLCCAACITKINQMVSIKIVKFIQ